MGDFENVLSQQLNRATGMSYDELTQFGRLRQVQSFKDIIECLYLAGALWSCSHVRQTAVLLCVQCLL